MIIYRTRTAFSSAEKDSLQEIGVDFREIGWLKSDFLLDLDTDALDHERENIALMVETEGNVTSDGRVTVNLPGYDGDRGLAEIQLFGEGSVAETEMASNFGGTAPFLELPASWNLRTIELDAHIPRGTDPTIQTNTRNTVKQIKTTSRR